MAYCKPYPSTCETCAWNNDEIAAVKRMIADNELTERAEKLRQRLQGE